MSIDLTQIQRLVLDAAPSQKDSDTQEAFAELVSQLLERQYPVWLFSSSADLSLDNEDFSTEGLTYLTDEMPPNAETLEAYPHLKEETTLWVTDAPAVLDWLVEQNLPVAQQETQVVGGQTIRFKGYIELATVLDPNRFSFDALIPVVGGVAQDHHPAPVVVGVSGPKTSGYQTFTLAVQQQLEDAGLALVEVVDLTHFLNESEDLEEGAKGLWKNEMIGQWLLTHLFKPLGEGKTLYWETPPKLDGLKLTGAIHSAWEDFFPLFVGEGAVVLVLGEMLYHPPLQPFFHFQMLLDVPLEERVRRLYELPGGETVEPAFVEQFKQNEGRHYEAYLRQSKAKEMAHALLDATTPLVFRLKRLNEPD